MIGSLIELNTGYYRSKERSNLLTWWWWTEEEVSAEEVPLFIDSSRAGMAPESSNQMNS